MRKQYHVPSATVNAGSGTVSVIDVRAGTLVRTVPVARNPIPLAIDEGAQRVFVATGTVFGRPGNFPPRGTLSVLDACSGSLLRTYPVGTDPSAVAVDTQRGRVFVLNRISRTVTVLGGGSNRPWGDSTCVPSGSDPLRMRLSSRPVVPLCLLSCDVKHAHAGRDGAPGGWAGWEERQPAPQPGREPAPGIGDRCPASRGEHDDVARRLVHGH